LNRVYRNAALILNLHGGTVPRPEHCETGRLVYIGTDPVEHEVALYHGDQGMAEYLQPHCAFFTWGANYGSADCRVPASEDFPLIPTRQPIVMDFWEPFRDGPADTFTTIGNWRQLRRPVELDGELYHWSKHLEFAKFIDLPRRCDQRVRAGAVTSTTTTVDSLGDVREVDGFTTDVDVRHYRAVARQFTVAMIRKWLRRRFSDRARLPGLRAARRDAGDRVQQRLPTVRVCSDSPRWKKRWAISA
jgi:hypothetical protein